MNAGKNMGSIIFKKPPIKKLRKEGMFGVDLHFHTKYSLDAISMIPAAVKKAEKKGFGFAITDHNTVRGVMESYKIRKHALIIPGIEVTCKNGNHMLAYFYSHHELEEFFNRKIKPNMCNPFFTNLSAVDVLNELEDYNCISCAPHPYAPGAVSVMNMKQPKELEKRLDLIEVINGYNFRKYNLEALYWATKIEKYMTGGSDGHSSLELGRVLTFTQGSDTESIFKDILKGKSIVMGKEDNLFVKTFMTIRKEKSYITNCRKMHIAKNLLKSHFKVEYTYFRNRFKEKKMLKMVEQHNEEKKVF